MKTANVFVDANWNAKIGDFGLAKHWEWRDSSEQLQMRQNKMIEGTFSYMAPEVFENATVSGTVIVFLLPFRLPPCNLTPSLTKACLLLHGNRRVGAGGHLLGDLLREAAVCGLQHQAFPHTHTQNPNVTGLMRWLTPGHAEI